jgi:uncharacterized protein
MPVRCAIALAVGLVVVTGCSGGSDAAEPLPTGTVVLRTEAGPIPVRVEVADTREARAKGLMGRASLASDAGMAFLFDEPTGSSFWMKNTLIPLSIAFWSTDGRIVAMLDMAPCHSDPCPRYEPGIEYVGALEVNVGFFRDHGVAVGDAVELNR